ncbi:MAG: hypothetical protein WCS31_00940 [Verrucomicrobiae bacterium]
MEKLLADGAPQSNTLKRLSAADRGEQLVSLYSLAGQRDADMDAAADAEWNRKMDTALKVTATREKLLAQKEAEEFFAESGKVNPEDPEWPSHIATLAANKPRGFSDPRVQQVVGMQKAIHDVARVNAEKLRLEEDRKTEQQARRLDTVKARVAELPESSQGIFHANVAQGEDPFDAFGVAQGHSAELSARAKLAGQGLTPEEIAAASINPWKNIDTSHRMLVSTPRPTLTDESRVDPVKAATALKAEDDGKVQMQEYRLARTTLGQNARAKTSLRARYGDALISEEERAAVLQDMRDLDEDNTHQREIIGSYETQRGLGKPAPAEQKTKTRPVSYYLKTTDQAADAGQPKRIAVADLLPKQQLAKPPAPPIEDAAGKSRVLRNAIETETDPTRRTAMIHALQKLDALSADPKQAQNPDALRVTASTPIVTTKEEYDQIPPGTLYVNPRGKKAIKRDPTDEEGEPASDPNKLTPEGIASTKAQRQTALDAAAREWVRANPNDPRTPEILKRLNLNNGAL